MSVYSCWQLQRRKKKPTPPVQFSPPLPGQDPGILTFEDLIVQTPGPNKALR